MHRAACAVALTIAGLSACAGSNPAASPALSTAYRIAGRVVRLADGRHEEPVAPGSAARRSTTIFGSPLAADLDGDGDEDAAVLLVDAPGGSGTFYYVAVAERGPSGYVGSDAVLLGDRIAPQKMTFENGVLTVTFAERKPGEPMSTAPSVARSRRFVFTHGALEEVAPASGD